MSCRAARLSCMTRRQRCCAAMSCASRIWGRSESDHSLSLQERGSMRIGWRCIVYGLLLGGLVGDTVQAQELPIFDTHIHYSRSDWDRLTPGRVLELLDQAGEQRALVSCTPDDGPLQ